MSTLPNEYGPLTDELLRRASKRRQAISGVFELTSRCNLVCRMCYVRHPAGDAARQAKELPATAWLSLARQAVENGMVFLLLTGGEPFLRPDFFEIYDSLTRMGLMLTLVTNGTLITEAIAERLAQAPPSRTEITLYGATAATYEAITGVPGSYEQCLTGITVLINRRIPLWIKTTITRQNVGELETIRQMAHGWGVPFSGRWLLAKRSDGGPSEVEECRLSALDGVTLEATDRVSADEWNDAALGRAVTPSDDNSRCLCGTASFAVNSVGEMNFCIYLPRPAAKPMRVGFTAAWEQVQRYVDSWPHIASACLTCDAQIYCNRCPAWSFIETGTLTEPVPYVCQIARARRNRYERST